MLSVARTAAQSQKIAERVSLIDKNAIQKKAQLRVQIYYY